MVFSYVRIPCLFPKAKNFRSGPSDGQHGQVVELGSIPYEVLDGVVHVDEDVVGIGVGILVQGICRPAV